MHLIFGKCFHFYPAFHLAFFSSSIGLEPSLRWLPLLLHRVSPISVCFSPALCYFSASVKHFFGQILIILQERCTAWDSWLAFTSLSIINLPQLRYYHTWWTCLSIVCRFHRYASCHEKNAFPRLEPGTGLFSTMIYCWISCSSLENHMPLVAEPLS